MTSRYRDEKGKDHRRSRHRKEYSNQNRRSERDQFTEFESRSDNCEHQRRKKWSDRKQNLFSERPVDRERQYDDQGHRERFPFAVRQLDSKGEHDAQRYGDTVQLSRSEKEKAEHTAELPEDDEYPPASFETSGDEYADVRSLILDLAVISFPHVVDEYRKQFGGVPATEAFSVAVLPLYDEKRAKAKIEEGRVNVKTILWCAVLACRIKGEQNHRILAQGYCFDFISDALTSLLQTLGASLRAGEGSYDLLPDRRKLGSKNYKQVFFQSEGIGFMDARSEIEAWSRPAEK